MHSNRQSAHLSTIGGVRWLGGWRSQIILVIADNYNYCLRHGTQLFHYYGAYCCRGSAIIQLADWQGTASKIIIIAKRLSDVDTRFESHTYTCTQLEEGFN